MTRGCSDLRNDYFVDVRAAGLDVFCFNAGARQQVGDVFQIFWMKVPILFAVFLSSPWVLYQVWAFVAPGLYKKERRYASAIAMPTPLVKP